MTALSLFEAFSWPLLGLQRFRSGLFPRAATADESRCESNECEGSWLRDGLAVDRESEVEAGDGRPAAVKLCAAAVGIGVGGLQAERSGWR
jgi:hypothetical protein